MKLLLATNHLGLGGSESYLLTVAEQLDRLGHEAIVYTPEPDRGAEVARERGIEVAGEEVLGQGFDAALVQDGGVAYQVAERCPRLPQVFVAHSETFDLQAPPQLEGVVAAVVALNDRVARRVRSFAGKVEVVRLRQPIDTERFQPRGALPGRARRALLLSNAPNADRLTMLEQACAQAGLSLDRLGGLRGQEADIRPALAGAEIVIGYGRSILEAMACGRAAYVYDWTGGDGWVTRDSYAEIEADGIAGRSGRKILDPAGLAEDLRSYAASMGPVNHDLVMAHHRANVHAQELLELLGRVAPTPSRPPVPLQEMARLVRLEWRARSDGFALAHENAHLRGLLAESERAVGEAREEARALEAEVARRGHETAQAYETTTSWRLTSPLRALGAILRRAGRWGRHRADAPGSGPTTSGGGSPTPAPAADREKAPPSRDR